ncbi:MAG: helix-turn-helix domain-containing protein [Clostridia bacterium]|nr:helix-turn-helix domain-containing protein [Clostridia bacterium]
MIKTATTIIKYNIAAITAYILMWWFRLNGRQLYLLRIKRDISREKLAGILGITANEITIYENNIKAIPTSLYQQWIKVLS